MTNLVKDFCASAIFCYFCTMDNNSHTSSGGRTKNIYARGADDGAWMGLCLVALFALMVLSTSVPMAALPAVAGMAAVPVLTYFFLRRTHIAAHGMTVYSALWMQGITMFACGSLIFGAAAFAFLRWIDPTFIRDVLVTAAEYYDSLDNAAGSAMADELHMIVRSNAVPPPGTVVLGWMWLVIFSGSLLSMLVAAVVKARKVPAKM